MAENKKQVWKPGTMLNPVPAVLVSCVGKNGETNLMTAAWTGVLCSDPATVYVSVRPERYSHQMIRESGEYVLNLTTEALTDAADFCGVKSGRDTDKWKETGLTRGKAAQVAAPLVDESPVNIECRVTDILKLGSHDVFVGEVLAVDVDEAYIDEKGKFDLGKCGLIAYCHGEYRKLGGVIGTFGYTVRKRKGRGKKAAKK